MKRSKVVALGAGMALAVSMAGCSDSDEATHSAVCVEEATQTRVDDDRCDDGRAHPGFLWFYYPVGYSAPPVGSRITAGSGTHVKPAAATVTRVPAKGGFGTTLGTSGG